jgi:ABC-type multidrug transport system ATPase subunit
MKIEAVNLAKRFNREWIFRAFNYTFDQGRIYAVTGPNGSGKSTLLRILWGQLPPSDGEVRHFAQSQVDKDEVYQHVAIATPYMDLIEEFTLEEMTSFHFKFKKTIEGLTPRDIIARLELPTAGNKPISNFSSGMRQRLKLGLAFHTASPFLFLDEPSTNLDDKAAKWYHDLLSRTTGDRVVIIASNQSHEYPPSATRIDIQAYK